MNRLTVQIPNRFILITILIAGFVLVAGLAGCGGTTGPGKVKVLPDRKAEYKKSQQAERNLEIPPDLTSSSINDTLVVPNTRSDTSTLSGYIDREKAAGGTGSRSVQGVLPKFDGMEVRRDGDQRWLEIQATPEDVWFTTLDFWQESGILLIQQDPEVGIMVTDWLENLANIKTDFVTDAIRGLVNSLYSSSTRDQYRVRIEPGLNPDTTELYLTHRGLEEKVIQDPGGDLERTVWNPRGTEQDLEVEMLRRLMVYMGTNEQRSQSALTGKSEATQPRSQIIRNNNEVSLRFDVDLARAWRLTGVALDRVGFAVEDRDRSLGTYYVRYNDPMKDSEEPGFLSKLLFWRDKDRNIDKENQYQVNLQPNSASTQILILNSEGVRDNSETALRILTLLHEQLR